MRPDRVVFGCDSEQAALLMRALYAPFPRTCDRMRVMDLRSAELTKCAANAMLATRISFMNELAGLAEALGADIEQVRRGIGRDVRIGTHFSYAGCGRGGGCLPKDLPALVHMGELAGLDMPMLAATREVNRRQRFLLVERLCRRYGDDMRGQRFAVWGLAFKPGTDDQREAPSLETIDALLARGANVAACDRVAMTNARQGWAGQVGPELVDNPPAAADGASALLVLTEWRECRSPDFAELTRRMRYPLVLEGRDLYEPWLLANQGIEHHGIGRGCVNPSGGLADMPLISRQTLLD